MLENFFRSLMMTICSVLYPLIPKLYSLFYDIASTKLLTTEQIQTFSRNIYVLVSVVMLFAFAVKAIESIINPDMLFDSKKGFTSVIKRSLIAICLIIFIPFGFNYFYKAQEQILEKNLIEKVLVGIQISDGENVADKSGAGQILAGTAIAAVLYPSSDDVTTSSETLSKNYSKMVEKDVSKIKDVGDNINEKVNDDDTYVLQFEWLPAVLMGAFMVYFLVLFCIDTALRLIKMAFLELTAPISVVAYIFAGDDMLKRWFKEVKNSAISVFVRIAALALMIYIMSFLPSFIDKNFNGKDYGWIANLLIIMAILMFVKEAPKLIEKIFGVEIPQKGGIAGRLGNMAGVGKVAQSAWGALRGVGGAAAVLGGAALGAGALGGLKSIPGAYKSIKNGTAAEDFKNKLKSMPKNISSGASRAGSVLHAGAGAGSVGGGLKAGVKAYKDSPVSQLNKVAKDQLKQYKKYSDLYEKLGIDPETNEVENARDSINKYSDALDKVSANRTAKENLKKLDTANRNKGVANKIKDNTDNISKKLLEARDNTTSNRIRQNLENLEGKFKSGNISANKFAQEINSMVDSGDMSEETARNILGNLDGVINLTKNNGLESKLIKADGSLDISAIKDNVKSAEYIATTAKANYDAASNLLNDKDKKKLEPYISASDTINEKYVKETGKGDSKYKESVSSPSTNTSSNNSSKNSGYNSNNSNGENSNSNGGNGYNNNQSSSPNTSSPNNNPSNNSSNGNNSSGQDLSGFFNNLSKDIQNANQQTNSILEEQLKAQKSILDENQKQNTKLNNIDGGINDLNRSVDRVNDSIKKSTNQINDNLKNISRNKDDE